MENVKIKLHQAKNILGLLLNEVKALLETNMNEQEQNDFHEEFQTLEDIEREIEQFLND